jgi:UPF0271 protein
MSTIDLNADLGEGMGTDEALLAIVSSASIATGGHAGDADTMRSALTACKARGVRVGAHPGFADKANFGRTRLHVAADVLTSQLQSQLVLFHTLAAQVGVPVEYFKLHGALANMAAEDFAFATGVIEAIQAVDPEIAILALDASQQVFAADALGVPVILEAYADRAYTPDGQLVSRSLPGAVIHDTKAVVDRCLMLARYGEIIAIDGTVFRSSARSICLHGDTPGAVALAGEIRAALEASGVTIAAMPA